MRGVGHCAAADGWNAGRTKLRPIRWDCLLAPHNCQKHAIIAFGPISRYDLTQQIDFYVVYAQASAAWLTFRRWNPTHFSSNDWQNCLSIRLLLVDCTVSSFPRGPR
jgi:hypothetical protein